MCLYPRLRTNPKYKGNKKNGGRIPKPTDMRVTVVPVKCGGCIECRKQKTRDWAIRLKEEIRQNNKGLFVTLTFSNQSITDLYNDNAINNLKGYDLDNAAAKLAVRRFYERWRAAHGTSIRHWLVTELGHEGTENIHMHGIIWSQDKNEITKRWKYGRVWYGTYVSERTVNYCMKYVMKIDPKHRSYKAKILTSPGMGDKFTDSARTERNQYKPGKTDETYQDRTGRKSAMPTYYRNKIYSDEQREQLWIEKLNKADRYVLGQKVNTATETGKLLYEKMLKEAQRQNKQLGLGNGNHNWTLANYELERRELLQKKRAEKKKIEEINKEEKQTHEEVKQTLGTNSKRVTGHPADADRSTDRDPSQSQAGVGVLPAIADRSDLGAPQQEKVADRSDQRDTAWISEEQNKQRIQNLISKKSC